MRNIGRCVFVPGQYVFDNEREMANRHDRF